MGLYSEYGIEFCAIIDEKLIIIVPIKELDERLLGSKYYKTRKQFYQDHKYKSWREKIDNIDITLTNIEKDKLNIILEDNKNKVIEYGWYDVGYIGSSLS